VAVDRFAAWFWQRFRGRYFLAIGAAVVIFDCVALLIPFAVIIGGLWHLSAVDTLQICGLVAVAACIAVASGIGTSVELRRIISRWVDGDHSNPALVRDAVLAGPEGMAMRGGFLGSPFLLLVVVPIVGVKLDFSLRGFVAIELMGMVTLALASFLMANGLRLLTAPLLFEIASEMPVDARPLASTWSLRSLFGVGMFLGAALAGIAGGIAAFTFGGTKQTSALAAVIAAFVMGAYAAILNRFCVIEPTLAPLRDLVRAT